MALLKSPSRLSMTGFQGIFSNFITAQPRPIINVNQDVSNQNLSHREILGSNVRKLAQTWLDSPCFSIEITLPYLCISNHDKRDTRYVAASTALRSRFNISSLNTHQHSCGTQDEITASRAEKDHLYMTTWSMFVTGVSEQYWTAYCFDDNFFDEEERGANDYSEDPILISSSPEDHAAGIVRPTLPRAYALRALAMQLDRISRYHEQAHLLLATDFKTFVRI